MLIDFVKQFIQCYTTDKKNYHGIQEQVKPLQCK